jgi:acetyl esterase/lipase
MPVLVWIHGGGWHRGSKRGSIGKLLPFARKSFFCISIDYRLSGEATFPAQIQDCKCAIRFLRAHAAKYSLDPERIGVWGSSAAGHLAALLGTSGDVKEFEGDEGWEGHSSCVQAVCDWYGPADLMSMLEQPRRIDTGAANSPESLLIGGPVWENPEKAAMASPVSHVSKDDPPFLIMPV